MNAFLFFANALFCALNTALFVLSHSPVSLVAAIVSGFMAFFVVATL